MPESNLSDVERAQANKALADDILAGEIERASARMALQELISRYDSAVAEAMNTPENRRLIQRMVENLDA